MAVLTVCFPAISSGLFEASLSDGSAPTYSTELYQASGQSTRVVTLSFQAASAGQTLTVRYVVDRKDNPSAGSITLEAAALQGGGGGNQAPVLDPIGPQSVEENQTLTVAVSANDADGPTPLLLTATNLPTGANFTDFGDGSGQFSWTPITGDAAGSPYSVTFTATDVGGAGLADSETVVITVTPAGGTGGLTGSAAVAPSSVNLTSNGSADWIHWGLSSATDVNRKAGVILQISNYTPVGGAVPWLRTNMPTSYAWTDGTPTTSVGAARSTLGIFKVGKGVQFTVPANTRLKTLQVYVGTVKGATGRLEASLSDGSAPAYSTEIYQASGTSTRVVTLTFQAASAGQTLTVRYVVDRKDVASVGSITLEAAALQ